MINVEKATGLTCHYDRYEAPGKTESWPGGRDCAQRSEIKCQTLGQPDWESCGSRAAYKPDMWSCGEYKFCGRLGGFPVIGLLPAI